MILLICGKSGSGKDYIADKICRTFDVKKVISRTTRNKRYENENTHIFVSKKEAGREIKEAVCFTVYNNNFYYALYEDVIGKDIYIVDPIGLEKFKDSGIEFKSVYLDIPLYRRVLNMRKRGDSFKKIFERIKFDNKAFKDIKTDISYKSNDKLFEEYAEMYLRKKERQNGR